MYIPLYNKSNYTLLSSLLKIDDLVMYAKNNNISSIALSDSNMYATMEFIKKCEKEHINPIVGEEKEINNNKIVLFAKDYDGYKSLIKLSTIQSERSINKEDLEKYNKNVIAVVPFTYMELYNEIGDIFLDLYLGISNKKEEKEALIITKNVLFFRESLYLKEEDKDYLSYMYLIRDGKTILDNMEYDLSNHELIIDNISNHISKKSLDNTVVLAEQCKLILPKAKNLLPIYDCPDPKKYLYSLCQDGLKKRLNNNV